MDFLRMTNASNSRRTNSVPGSRTRAVYRQTVPRALTDALCAARERFECFRHTKRTDTVDARGNPSNLPEAKETGKDEKNGGRTEPASTSITKALSSSSSAELQAPITRCVAFDAVKTMRAMQERRSVRDHCPVKIAAFLAKLRVCVESAAASAPVGAVGHSVADSTPRLRSGNQFAALHQATPSIGFRGQWENRLEAPIAISSSVGRKRGIFGDVERKELHHLVISILNRVTNDAEKYREVKNELLRLPIPEANDVMLRKIVDVFFQKALREQHFSKSYADLVCALCKVPDGQRIVGDKSQSLEYRLRQQLVTRCQVEFQELEQRSIELAAQGGEDRNTSKAEETFKGKRDRTCGILRFVGELFIRHIVTENVIMHILMCTSTGPDGSLRVPPVYTPTESQMDETITLLNIVDTAFFQTPSGTEMLLKYTNVLQHWSTHHPVSRIRLLLLSVVERLKRFVEERGAALKQQPKPPQQRRPQQKQSSHQQHQAEAPAVSSQVVAVLQNTHTPTTGQQPSLCSSELHSESLASTDRRPPTARSSETTSPTDKPVVYVGGKPIPIPRSAASRNGSTNVSLSCTLTSNASLMQPATTESVAKYMESITSLGRSIDDVVMEITAAQTSLISVVELWTERCLNVVKVEKSRAIYGTFLSSLNAHSKGTLRDELRKVAMDAFKSAVGNKLYEDLHIFRYWVSMVCSDLKRQVLDEELLNESLSYLLSNEPGAVKPYLGDVAHGLKLVAGNCRASDESCNFVRYRPLRVIHCHNTRREQGYELRMVNFTDVCTKSLEIHVFCALMTGSPPKEELFEYVRSCAPRSTAFAAPEVLSAILHAELCSNTTDFLEDNIPLLHLAGDGPDREAREILLIAELHAVLKDTSGEGSRPNSAISRVMAKLDSHLISDETKSRAQRYFQSREEYAQHIVGTQGTQVALQVRTNTGNSNGGSNNNKNNNHNSQNAAVSRRHTSQRR